MSRRRTHVGALAIALACTLAGTLSAAGPASAASTGFHIYNLSGSPMKLVNVTWDGAPEKGRTAPLPPKVGSMLMPGGPPLHVEIAYDRFNLSRSSVDLGYKPMNSKSNDLIRVSLHDAFRGADCSVTLARSYQCRVHNSETITLLDPPGTVNNVSSGHSQEQADVLRQLCNETNSATCTFTPTRRTPTLTPRHIVGQPLANCDDEDKVDTRLTREDTVGTTNSVEVEVGGEIEVSYLVAKVKASIKYKYGHEWLEEHKFSQDVSLTVKPGWVGWVAATQPVLRDTGDFTLELGNTTWNLKDVSFETPDPRPNDGGMVSDGYKLSEDEYASTCTHKRPGLTQVPSHFVQMQWKGTSDHDVLLAGQESHTVRGFAGNDLLRGGQGHDALHGGRDDDTLNGGLGRDTLHGGRDDDILDGGSGRDTLIGGPGADTMIDNGGPTLVRTGADTGPGKDTVNVRDGRSDDTVICGSRRSTVLVDAGDSVIGRCGRLSRSASTR
jgi:hypothetical protein